MDTPLATTLAAEHAAGSHSTPAVPDRDCSTCRLAAMSNPDLMEALRIAKANLAAAEERCPYRRPVYRERYLATYFDRVALVEEERGRRLAAR
jgi:hypothetical protein